MKCMVAIHFPDTGSMTMFDEHPDGDPHVDDLAVDRFAAALKQKLASARAKGRDGWQTCDVEFLQEALFHHVHKGDPADVGNFAMFLWNRGARTAYEEQWVYDLTGKWPGVAPHSSQAKLLVGQSVATQEHTGRVEAPALRLADFLNAANISASDMPHTVVEKLQSAIDAGTVAAPAEGQPGTAGVAPTGEGQQ